MSGSDASQTPEFSIIICTQNRELLLSQAVESIFNSKTEGLPCSYELIVVDNNSSDNTKERVDDLAKRALFPIRYVHEPQLGLSHARNAGIRNSRGNYLAFIDDDCTVHPDWLFNLMNSFVIHECDIVQGKILLNLRELALPDWIDQEDLVNLGLFDHGDQSKTFDNVVGGNMCFRRAIFEEYGLFDTRYGAGTSGVGEDTEFSQRINRGNARLLYVPDVIVFHIVRKEKLNREFFLDRQYTIGYNFTLIRNNYDRRFLNKLSLRKKILNRSAKCFFYSLTGKETKKYKQQKRIALYRGKLRALRENRARTGGQICG